MAGERALEIFKEDLSGGIEVAKAAAQRMSVIAVVMGKAATKSQLLPYVIEKVRDPETADEILYRLAEQLDIAHLIGGFDPMLVAPLEALCQTEETLVRDAAAKSINALVAAGSGREAKEFWAPMLVRLCAESNWFTARVSAARIYARIYAAVEGAPDPDEMLMALRELMTARLVQDEAPMVKRAAVTALGELAAQCKGKAVVRDEMRPILKQLLLPPSAGGAAIAEGDAVRVAAVGALPAFAALCANTAEGHAALVELCTAVAHDRSWKLRVALAQSLGAVAKAAASRAGQGGSSGSGGASTSSAEFAAIFDALQRDPEAEVRFVTANRSAEMAEATAPAEVAQVIVPNLLALVTDKSYRTAHERAALSAILVPLILKVDAGSDAAQRIVGTVGAILSSQDDSQFVRIQLIESSPKLVAAVGPASAAGKDLLAKLLRFLELPSGTAAEASARAAAAAAAAAASGADAPIAGSNPKWCWRLRYAAADVVGSDEFLGLGLDLYREHLAPITRQALVDSCALVRVAALGAVAKWAAKYAGHGAAHGQWADENLVSELTSLRAAAEKGALAKSYAHRLTTIHGLEVSAGYLSSNGLATLAGLIADKDAICETPNVRLAVARCFGRLSQSLDFQGSPVEGVVNTTLHKLATDADIDVKAMAAAALASERLPLTFTAWGPNGAPWIPAK
ncbi:hypothetical protein KFE25_003563 [Diacronema lutheri]|uniref:Uncharacterized protein n=1 Tax=Diacronema lutheri TaxID=2081491 RepID=A0A8J5X6R3_DIALT|nr:hypothetical protein KFE25_003563 [Diacronema lutheri]